MQEIEEVLIHNYYINIKQLFILPKWERRKGQRDERPKNAEPERWVLKDSSRLRLWRTPASPR
jgi:hypothetical protein